MTTAVATETLHTFTQAEQAGRPSFKVKDLSLAEFGRKEIRLAEQEMPGSDGDSRRVRRAASR